MSFLQIGQESLPKMKEGSGFTKDSGMGGKTSGTGASEKGGWGRSGADRVLVVSRSSWWRKTSGMGGKVK